MRGSEIMKNKYTMRTPEEKEQILLEYYSGNIGRNEICKKYGISITTLKQWRKKYKEDGIEGLKSKSGKKKGLNKGRPKNVRTYQEELELKIMKLEIENARLKKGYLVKGDGAQKEYVTTLEENTK